MSEFKHLQSAHCESGVMASLLSHGGLPMTEPMAFGLSAALTFAYVPFVRVSGMPLIGYRMPPRHIVRGIQKRVGVKMHAQTFRNQDEGMRQLDRLLDEGKVVGLQTSVYWLPYFPETMRFHFNAHNLLVYGRDGDEYLISDPVFEHSHRCDAAALKKARFAKGALAAKGLLYYPTHIPASFDLEKTSQKAIKANLRYMTGAPVPIIGLRGIRHMGKKIQQLAADAGKVENYLPHFLNHVVRMQEEIGTGGAGFRFMYASFLRETGNVLNNELLREAAETMADAGDEWRKFALLGSKMSKGRQPMDGGLLAQQLTHCEQLEGKAWDLLRRY